MWLLTTAFLRWRDFTLSGWNGALRRLTVAMGEEYAQSVMFRIRSVSLPSLSSRLSYSAPKAFWVGLGVVVMLASQFLLPSQAQAEIYQCGTNSNYFDGFLQQYGTGSYEGAYALLVNQFGAVCDTDKSAPNPGSNDIGSNFTTAWTMIASGNRAGWVQSGFIRGYNSPQYVFSQVYGGGTDLYNRFPANPSLSNGEENGYGQRYVPSCGCEYSKFNNTVITQSNFNPYANWAFPFSPQYSGEATYTQNDIPGVPSAQTAFSSMQVQRSSDDVFQSVPCGLLASKIDSSRWARHASSCTAFNIWTSNTS
jgi:hypothetical protein